jgi:hypothetical protein
MSAWPSDALAFAEWWKDYPVAVASPPPHQNGVMNSPPQGRLLRLLVRHDEAFASLAFSAETTGFSVRWAALVSSSVENRTEDILVI